MSSTSRKYLPYLLSLLFLVLFWEFRSAVYDGGNSDLWVRNIEEGIWFRKRRMASFFLIQLIYRITNLLFHWNARWVFNFISCVAGSVFIFILYKICQRWSRGWIPFCMVASTGMMSLFYGHIADYALVMAATSIFFYYLFEYVDDRTTARLPALLYSLAGGFHLVVGFIFPVLPLAWFLKGHKKEDAKQMFLGLIPLMVLWILVRYIKFGEGDLTEGLDWVGFSPRWVHGQPYTLFCRQHLLDFLWYLYRVSTISIPVIILGFLLNRKPYWKDKIFWILVTATVCLFIYIFFSNPGRVFKFWDVMAIFGFPSALLAGYLIREIPWAKEIAIVLTAVSLYFSFPFVLASTLLGHRGEGTIIIENMPPNAILQLDGYKKNNPIYHVLEGAHKIRIIVPPHIMSENMTLHPNETIMLKYQPDLN